MLTDSCNKIPTSGLGPGSQLIATQSVTQHSATQRSFTEQMPRRAAGRVVRHGSGLKRGLSKDDLNLSRLMLTESEDKPKTYLAEIPLSSQKQPIPEVTIPKHGDVKVTHTTAQINEGMFSSERIGFWSAPNLKRSKSERCACHKIFLFFYTREF